MATVAGQPQISVPAKKPSGPMLSGRVVYMYAFDIAYDMLRTPIRQLLGQPVEQFVVDASKRGPKQMFFYRPLIVRLPSVQRDCPMGPVTMEREVKLLPIGALSIRISIPFSVERIDQLICFHELHFTNGGSLYSEVRELAEQVRKELNPHLVRPAATLPEEEAYTAFCIQGPIQSDDGRHWDAEDWLDHHRRQIASLLTEEPDPTHLADQEAIESTGKSFSYFEDDLVVIDWDAALIVDQPPDFDEVLYVMELSNVQLAELEAYDRLLDEAVERASRDLSVRRLGGFRTIRIQRELRELRIDLARLSDELSNITKFFGDWHLARIYQGLADRFHLADWHKIIDEKLHTLDDLYQILRSDQTNRTMLTLEIAVVILFVLELVNSIWHLAR